MQIPLLRGRFFTAQDDEHSPLVTVIDESLARRYFPDQDPIGKRINLSDQEKPAEIVGIVKHVRQWSLGSDDESELQAQLYRPFMQLPNAGMVDASGGISVVLRYKGESPAIISEIRQHVRLLSNEHVLYNPLTMDQVISAGLATRRYSMGLLSGFAGLALLLAAMGIYGVISYFVGQRTQEIGIRMALGATRFKVIRLLLGQASIAALAGLVVGLMGSLALTHLLKNLLFGVSATDPLTFFVVSVILGGVALLAGYLPARRATRVDPGVALRCE
jgi:predicted permease